MKPSTTYLNICTPLLISSVKLQCDLFYVVTISITLLYCFFLYARPSNIAHSYSLAFPTSLSFLFLLLLMASNHKAISAAFAPQTTSIDLLPLQAVYIYYIKKDQVSIPNRTTLLLSQVKSTTTKLFLTTRTPFT